MDTPSKIKNALNATYEDGAWKEYDLPTLQDKYNLIRQFIPDSQNHLTPVGNQGVADGLEGMTTQEIIAKASKDFAAKQKGDK